jgi:NAD(P)-dependent dehydrogenase (short-subunit alcohol dehydrogenase family)
MSTFEDRVAVVTGAASGIGFEMAAQLRARGATVVGVDLRSAGVPEGCEPVDLDVSDAAALEAAITSIVGRHGRIDLLFNNAGIGSTADPVSCTVEEWDRVFAVDVRAVFLATKFTLPSMLAQGRGVIINTASVAGLVGLRDRTAYCAAKGAVISFTKQVAIQYAGTGIRCNCICPGTVDSPWVGRLLDAADDPVAARASLTARQPIGRLGRPDEIAKAALYLASDDADFVTGTAMVIDGGLVAG